VHIGDRIVATVRNCSIHGWKSNESNPGAHGLYWRGSNGLVEHNEIYDNNGWGLQFYYGQGSANNNVFRNNYVHDNGDGTANGGILIATGDNNRAYNNVFANNAHGVRVRGTNTKILNNTVYNSLNSGIELPAGSNASIYNNIVYQNRPNIRGSGTNVTLLRNFTTDPRFVNPVSGDFRLQPDSPAINVGMTLPEVPSDFTGNQRPAGSGYDMGAHEFRSDSGNDRNPPAPRNLRLAAR
jgi:hypothetical protein